MFVIPRAVRGLASAGVAERAAHDRAIPDLGRPDRLHRRLVTSLRRYWWIALVFAVLVARRPDAFTTPQFWAEDAVVFHAQAEAEGLRSLVHPIAGYHHLIPRLAALAATTWVDARWQPAAFNFAAVLVILLACAGLGVRRWEGPPAALCALAIVLVGQADEILISLTNAQWITMLVIVMFCVVPPPSSRRGQWAEAAALLLVGLTGPFAVVLWPLALIRLWAHGRAALRSAAALTIAAAVQAVALVQAPPHAPVPPGLADAPWTRIISFRLFVQTFLPRSLWPDSVSSQLAIGLALLAAALTAAFIPGPHRRLRATLLLAAVLTQMATAIRMNPDRDLLLMGVDTAPRYLFDARILLAWLFITVASGGSFPRLLRATAAVCVTAWFVTAALTFRIAPLPDLQWSRYAPAVRAGRPADIPVNPVPWVYHYPGRPERTSSGSK